MMYPRLKIAKELLKDDGLIFISINDKEIHNLKKICDEIFGYNNEIATLIWDKNHSAQAGIYKVYHEYIVVYAKNINLISRPSSINKDTFEAGAMKKVSGRHPASEFTFPVGTRFDAPDGTIIEGEYGGAEKVIITQGKMIAKDGKLTEKVTLKAGFTQANQMRQYFYGDRNTLVDSQGKKIIEFYFNSTGKIKIVKERSVETPQTTCKFGTQGNASNALANLFNIDESPFSSPKPVNMISDFVMRFTEPGDIVLDFFFGSATTAHSIMDINSKVGNIGRNYFLVQLQENLDDSLKSAQKDSVRTLQVAIEELDKINKPHTICELGKERIRRVAKKIHEENPDAVFDDGFKVFEVGNTTIRWNTMDDEEIKKLTDIDLRTGDKDALDFTIGHNDIDVVYEIMLRQYGIPLSTPIEKMPEISERTYIFADAVWFCQYHLTHFIRTRIMQRERYDHSRAFFGLPEAVRV